MSHSFDVYFFITTFSRIPYGFGLVLNMSHSAKGEGMALGQPSKTIFFRSAAMFDIKIQKAIEYHTRKIAKTCKLDAQSTDDVRQELTLKALEAQREYTPKGASPVTFIKTCLANKAADRVRQLSDSPSLFNADSLVEAEDIQYEYRRRRFPNKTYKPLTVSLGSQLEQLTGEFSVCDLDLKKDIETVLEKLSPRQKTICQLLMAGYTQAEIAVRVNLKKSRVSEIIRQLRPYFSGL
jgi:RNA polymerase sigma factor (sigma-70 family)